MARMAMNEYRVTLLDGTEKLAVRVDSRAVTNDYENTENPISQVQRTRVGLDVDIPETAQPVHFQVNVTPQAAVDADCVAAPDNYTVDDGTEVLLQAIPGAGFVFTGWFLDAPIDPTDTGFDPSVAVSTSLKYVLKITSPGPGLERPIEARFAPAP